jgi:2-oxoisovalerate dehydrogenase E1 component alpha subunit
LETLGIWDEVKENQLRAQCTAQVDAAVRDYQSRPAPHTDAMFDHLFANPPAGLAEQRELARRYGLGAN